MSGETYDASNHVIRIDTTTIHDDLIVLKQGSQVVVNKSLDDYEKKKFKVEDEKLNKDLGKKNYQSSAILLRRRKIVIMLWIKWARDKVRLMYVLM